MPESGAEGGLERPIVIVSAGRSGSTVFFDLLAHHPRVAWLSRLCNRFPERQGWNRAVLRALDLRPIAPLVRRAAYPGEVYRFWRHHARGFNMPFRDLRADDLTASQRRHLRSTLAGMTTPHRRRLLLKLTGWPRVGYMDALLPDALFVHVLRDGRAVANSFLQQPWWGGWGGPQNWRFGELTEEARRVWERHDRSFVALAGLQWNLLMDAFEDAARSLPPERWLEIRYEDLCADPVAAYRSATRFADLEWVPSFERAVRRARLSSANDRWREDLTPRQRTTLEAVVGQRLARHGYE